MLSFVYKYSGLKLLINTLNMYYDAFASIPENFKIIEILPERKFISLITLINWFIISIVFFEVVLLVNTSILEFFKEVLKHPLIWNYAREINTPRETIALFMVIVFVCPILEEISKFIALRFRCGVFVIIMFAIGELIMYVVMIGLKVNGSAEVIVGACIGVVILRICPLMMHISTIHIQKNDGLLKAIKFHFLWNLIIGRVFILFLTIRFAGELVIVIWKKISNR